VRHSPPGIYVTTATQILPKVICTWVFTNTTDGWKLYHGNENDKQEMDEFAHWLNSEPKTDFYRDVPMVPTGGSLLLVAKTGVEKYEWRLIEC
jgi:hypothetical protein